MHMMNYFAQAMGNGIPDPWGIRTRFFTMMTSLLYTSETTTNWYDRDDIGIPQPNEMMSSAIIVVIAVLFAMCIIWILKTLFEVLGTLLQWALMWLVMMFFWQLTIHFLFKTQGDTPEIPYGDFVTLLVRFVHDKFD